MESLAVIVLILLSGTVGVAAIFYSVVLLGERWWAKRQKRKNTP